MKISKIYVYPIKSLRGVLLESAELTKNGLPYDRSFALLKDYKDASKSPKGARYEHMAVSKFPKMCLFTTKLTQPTEDEPNGGQIEVTFTNPDDKTTTQLVLPLQPDTSDLAELDVTMHASSTKALQMPAEHSEWFSSCFGFDVLLVYIGPYHREVLGNLAPNAAQRNPKKQRELQSKSSNSIFSSITNSLPSMPAILGGGGSGSADDEAYHLQFADCSPYLVASETSLDDVSRRLPEGEDMDITKFRPNIILSGADKAWEEDFWGELDISSANGGSTAKLFLTSNCCRCTSINVDYDTGEFGKGASGEVLKRLMSDRRVDEGHKYAPTFGRYAFLTPQSLDAGVKRFEIGVGDDVVVAKRNEERTVFKWPGIGQTKKEDLYPV